MLTIKELWLEYEAECIPPDTPASTVDSVRTTFYAGALCVLTIIKELQGLPGKAANRRINNMFDEMTEFSRKLHESDQVE